MKRTLVLLLVALAAGASRLPAQRRAPAGPRLTGSSFVSTRYVAGKTMTMVGTQRLGSFMVVVGAKGKPSANEWTPMVGGGTRIRVTRDVRVTTMLVFFDTPGGGSLDLYALPSVRRGAWRLDGVMMLRQPLDGSRPRELSINPVAVSVSMLPGVRAGFGATLAAAEGKPTQLGAGFVAEVGIASGTVSAELMRRGGGLEKRVGYVIRF